MGKIIICAIALGLGNYFWQYITDQRLWQVAGERSYFQLWGLITYYLLFDWWEVSHE